MAWSTAERRGTSFVNRLMQIDKAVFWFCLAILMLLAAPGARGAGYKVLAGLIVLILIAYGVRTLFFSHTLSVGPECAQIKSLFRNRSFPYIALRQAETVSRRIGIFRCVCVRLTLKSGSYVDVTSVNERRGRGAIISEASEMINDRIRNHTSAP